VVASHTGLRASELASLSPASLALDGNSPTIKVAAAYSKRRRDDVQPIRADLAELLRSWLASSGRTNVSDRLWPGTWKDSAAKMLRDDLDAAGLAYQDEAGRVFDFHALRHQFISNLAAAGVHPKVAQQLARHSSITLTMDRYTHLSVADVAGALEELPVVPSERADRRPVAGAAEKLALILALRNDVGCRPMASGGNPEGDCQPRQRSRNHLPDGNLDKKSHPLATGGISEAEGTRTPNHRIDSPVL